MTTATPLAYSAARGTSSGRAVGLWLLGCCAMVLAMAVIGAITRLTESGLSIMEWAPISGALPPLSQAEWQRLFDLYRQIPEYREVNAGMSLAEFKTIFWWEYIHRLWGRLIGLVFALPFLWFWITGRLDRRMTRLLLFALLLGGLQGLLGWFMVASGFGERTDVSQYRLVAHLALALVIYGYLFWLALGQLRPQPVTTADPVTAGLRRAGLALLALVALTILSGGFVAGLNAGLVYNSFPLMDGDLVPAGYGMLAPWYLNLFENHAAVQFNHRLLAVVSVGFALLVWLWSRRCGLPPAARGGFAVLALLVLCQLALGIATLLLVVPVWAAALHQAGAILVLTALLWCLYHLRPQHRGRPS